MDLLAAPREAVASAFGLGSALRGERVLHPDGLAFQATVETVGGSWGADVLDERRQYAVTARVSRSIGLPRPLPDIGGLAIRFPGLGSGGAALDVLRATTGSAPVLRHLLVPESSSYTSLLPYRTGTGRWVVLGAHPDGDAAWSLVVAGVMGDWQPWGRLLLGGPLPLAASEGLRFMPTIGADDLCHPRLLGQLRARAYRRSQANRP
jgi:hypothetical protein